MQRDQYLPFRHRIVRGGAKLKRFSSFVQTFAIGRIGVQSEARFWARNDTIGTEKTQLAICAVTFGRCHLQWFDQLPKTDCPDGSWFGYRRSGRIFLLLLCWR